MVSRIVRGALTGACALALVGTIAGGGVLVATTIQDELCGRVRAAVSAAAANVDVGCDGRDVSIVVPDTRTRVTALAAVAGVADVDNVDWMIFVRGDPSVVAPNDVQAPPVPEPSWPVVVRFKGGEAGLPKQAAGSLAPVVRFLKANPTVRVRAVGYTDNGLDRKARTSLATLRTVAVLQYLNDKGVRAGAISIASRGAAKPVASNKTAAGRKQNRRVEIELVKES